MLILHFAMDFKTTHYIAFCFYRKVESNTENNAAEQTLGTAWSRKIRRFWAEVGI